MSVLTTSRVALISQVVLELVTLLSPCMLGAVLDAV